MEREPGIAAAASLTRAACRGGVSLNSRVEEEEELVGTCTIAFLMNSSTRAEKPAFNGFPKASLK